MNSSGKDTIQPKRLKERNINSGTPIDVSIRPYTIPHKAYLVTSRPKACDYKLTFSLASGMVVNTYETRETQSGKMGHASSIGKTAIKGRFQGASVSSRHSNACNASFSFSRTTHQFDLFYLPVREGSALLSSTLNIMRNVRLPWKVEPVVLSEKRLR